MKQKQRIVLFGMVAVALIFAACDSDSGNNSSESEEDSSSSIEFSSSSEQINSSSDVNFSSSSVGVSSSSAKEQSSSSVSLSSSVVKSSSSSVGISSSSVVVSSSSAILSISSSSSIEYGTLIYGGQTYKTVTIGTQTWMAENLNYAPMEGNAAVDVHSWCYNDDETNCDVYGRLYDWTATIDTLDSDCGYQHSCPNIVVPRRGICPENWHVPTVDEWNQMLLITGTGLDSINACGFSLQLAGYRNIKGETGNFNMGISTSFWTSMEYTQKYSYNMWISLTSAFGAELLTNNGFKFDAHYVRCLKD